MGKQGFNCLEKGAPCENLLFSREFH